MRISVFDSKKGMFFSFIAILILTFFMVIFSNIYSSQITKAELDTANAQITSANSFVVFLEDSYIPRVLRAISRKATLNLINKIEEDNDFVADSFVHLNENFTNLILYGRYNFWQDIGEIEHEDYFQNYMDKMRYYANKSFHLNLSIDYPDAQVEVYQEDTFFVDVDLNISFEITGHSSKWLVNDVYSIDFSIWGLRDPMYLVNQEDEFYNEIYNSYEYNNLLYLTWTRDDFFTYAFNGSTTNTTYYIPMKGSSSFLQRFYNTSDGFDVSDCCGIQSLIKPGKNAPANINLNNRSYVDYLFFNGTQYDTETTGDAYTVTYVITDCTGSNITTQANKFKLEYQNMMSYNMTGIYCDPNRHSFTNISACFDDSNLAYDPENTHTC